jgi:hypothetical protein
MKITKCPPGIPDGYEGKASVDKNKNIIISTMMQDRNEKMMKLLRGEKDDV